MLQYLGGIIGGGSSMIEGIAGHQAVTKAARDEQAGLAEAERAGLEEEDKAYAEEMKRLKPYEGFGAESLASLRDLLGYNGPDKQSAAIEALRTSPAYQFRLQQGTEAIDRSAAAKGGLFSGRTGLALTKYGQDLASTEYGNEYDRRANLTRAGYGIDTDFANRGGNYYRNRGEIRYKSRLRGGQIQAEKWRGLNEVQSNANRRAAASWGGSGGQQSGGGNNPYGGGGGGGNYYDTNRQDTNMNWGSGYYQG